ncbi:PP0621 family protein [uncultured Thiothrix sp.]|uniref:PP0621 family protein n=1 Tax=uncultured Thiothrix sp. TaxID=223185 RepID=UPI00345D67B6
MSRIIFILVLLVVGYLLLKSWQRRKQLDNQRRDAPSSGQIKNQQPIVSCQQCGLHVPQSEAVQHGGKFFCSLDHAQQAQVTHQSTPKDKR